MSSDPNLSTAVHSPTLTFTAEEVPAPFREKFILTGYRNPCSSATRCVGSAFYWTNETINIWTHLLPAFYFVSLAGYALWEMWRSDDSHLLPLCIYACSVSCYPLASATAHIFNAMSPRARHICFFIDYWALCVYGFGSALSYRAYSLPNSFLRSFTSSLYLPLAGCIAVAALAMSCHTRIMPSGHWTKFVRFASFAVPYFVDLAPMVYRLTVDGEGQSATADFYHRRQYAFAAAAAVFYCSHAPECWWPGQFDLIGHSHQIFHVLTVIGSRDQLIGLWLDAEHTSHPPSSPASFTAPLSTPLCLVQLLLVFAGMVLVMVHYIYKVTSLTCCEDQEVSISSSFTFKSSNGSLFDESQPTKFPLNGTVLDSAASAPTDVVTPDIGKEKYL